MTSTSKLKVFMHTDLVDELDYGFSPMDGIQAIDDLFIGLPKVHRSKERKNPRHKSRNRLRLYRARLAWYPLGFSYVQIGNELHVIELFLYDDWRKSNPRGVVPIVAAPPVMEVSHDA
jgi:hypothetical protein